LSILAIEEKGVETNQRITVYSRSKAHFGYSGTRAVGLVEHGRFVLGAGSHGSSGGSSRGGWVGYYRDEDWILEELY